MTKDELQKIQQALQGLDDFAANSNMLNTHRAWHGTWQQVYAQVLARIAALVEKPAAEKPRAGKPKE